MSKGDQRDDDVRFRYESGATMQEIADVYDVSRERIRQLLIRATGRSKFGGRQKIDPAVAMRALREASSWIDASRRSGISRPALQQLARELGVNAAIRRLYRLRRRAAMLQAIRDVAQEIGRPFRGGDFSGPGVLPGLPASIALRRAFGGIRKAVKAAGLPADWGNAGDHNKIKRQGRLASLGVAYTPSLSKEGPSPDRDTLVGVACSADEAHAIRAYSRTTKTPLVTLLLEAIDRRMSA
jgi:hypothetical protein